LNSKPIETPSGKVQKRILVVESDDEFRISITRLLNKQHFEIYSVENDAQAEKYLDKIQVGCIIFGLNQPVHESLLQLKKMIAHNQNPCVLILSAFDWQEVESEIGDMKYSEFVTKPVKQDQLLQLITRLKNKKQTH